MSVQVCQEVPNIYCVCTGVPPLWCPAVPGGRGGEVQPRAGRHMQEHHREQVQQQWNNNNSSLDTKFLLQNTQVEQT